MIFEAKKKIEVYMLSEISQTQRDKYQMLSHTWTLKKYSELITRTDRD